MLGSTVAMLFNGCYAVNDFRFCGICLWNNRAGAGWGFSCGSSTLPGVLILSLMGTDRWGWLALNFIISLRLQLFLSFCVADPSLSSCAYWKLFTIQSLRRDTEISIAGLALGGASPCRSVPSTNETEHAGDSCYNWSKQCAETCWCRVREAWWVVWETRTQWEVP